MKTSLAILMGLSLMATSAQAQKLRYAIGFPGGAAVEGAREFKEKLKAETGLELDINLLSLLNLLETPPGVRDGLADAGYVLTPYYPAEFSETNLAAEMSMLATVGTPTPFSGAVMAGAITEYVMLHCPDCQRQFTEQNQVFLGAIGTPEYVQLCTKPVRTIADLKGKKLRTSVAAMGRWAEHFGSTKVSLPANDVYEAMSQGVVDCTLLSAPELGNFQLFDVTKFVTLGLPGGSFAGVGSMNTNLDTWRGLSEEQRVGMYKLAPFNSAAITVNYYNAAATDLAKAKELGIEIIDVPQDLLEATEKFVAADVELIKQSFAKDFGLKDTDKKFEQIAGLIEKWKGLTQTAYNDKAAMTKLFEDEIFSKVDAASYGMN